MNIHIETERLIMRDLLPTDDEGMMVMESDPEVQTYLGKKAITDIEHVRRAIAFIRDQYVANGIGRWAVIEKSTGDFIGWSGLKLMTTEINGYVNYYDLGYRFARRYWGKGYATETALATVAYAWDTLNATELKGMADVDNAASRHVLEKCGMKPVNIFDYDGAPHMWYELYKNDNA